MKVFLPVLVFAKNDLFRLFRDKTGIFFVFAFPLILLFVFGGLMGREQDISFSIVLLNHSESEFAHDFARQLSEMDYFTIEEEINAIEEAQEQMARGVLDAVITLPEDFGLVSQDVSYPTGRAEVLYDRGREQVGVTLGSVLESIFAEINTELVPIETPFTVEVATTDDEGLTAMDYIFSGLLGFAILSLGIFGPITVFPRMKEKGILRRYHTTPIRVWQYFAGNVLSNAAIGLMSSALMFIVAIIVFDVSVRGDYVSLISMIVLGSITIFGIGLAIGGWAKNENQAAPLGNLIAFPLMFLSGVFFPRFIMPEWLQTISGYLPLTPLIDGLRLIITEGKTILDVLPEVGLLLGWLLVVYAIAFRVFRWE